MSSSDSSAAALGGDDGQYCTTLITSTHFLRGERRGVADPKTYPLPSSPPPWSRRQRHHRRHRQQQGHRQRRHHHRSRRSIAGPLRPCPREPAIQVSQLLPFYLCRTARLNSVDGWIIAFVRACVHTLANSDVQIGSTSTTFAALIKVWSLSDYCNSSSISIHLANPSVLSCRQSFRCIPSCACFSLPTVAKEPREPVGIDPGGWVVGGGVRISGFKVSSHSDINAIVGEDERRVGRSKFGSRHLWF